MNSVLAIFACLYAAPANPDFSSPVQGSEAGLHYYHFKQERPLILDPQRIAVRLLDGQDAPLADVAQLESAPLQSLNRQPWRAAALKSAFQTHDGVVSAMDSASKQGGVAFASPIFVGSDGGPVIVTPTILVAFMENVARERIDAIIAETSAVQVVERDWANMAGSYRLACNVRDGMSVLRIANALAVRPEVKYAEPDFFFTGRGSLIPNDPLFSVVWGIHNTGQSGGTVDMDMDGPEAWDITTGISSIKVLILDTGVQQNHPDINQLPGVDTTSEAPGANGGPTNACDVHGTAVAGCVSASINNSLGTVGIAPSCPSISGRFAISNVPCNGGWNSDASWTVNALAFGEAQGVRVTNNSNYYGFTSAAIESKYEQMRDNGVVHFASAGNDAQPVSTYPASLPTVNSIAALNRQGNRASFSNFGTDIFVSAPGQEVVSTDRTGADGYVGGDYVSVQGTSFASPYTAGVAALVISLNPALPSSSVESILASSAVDLGAPGRDNDFGWGFVNAHRALVTAQGGCNDPGPPDCNNNGRSDECDLFNGTSQDCNFNTIPDECESTADCQPNGVADICELATGAAFDCNGNAVPDSCDIAGAEDDCNSNFIPDTCDARSVAFVDNTRAPILGFVDIAATGTALNLADDGNADVTLPFVAPSLSSSSVRISNNGVIGFAADGDVINPNEPLPSSLIYNYATALLPFWDDLDSTTGNVYHQLQGTAPNRVFIVQWDDRPRFPGDAVLDGDEVTFQVQVYETPRTGAVAQFLYLDTFVGPPLFNNGRSATIGYQRDQTEAITYAHNQTDAVTPAVTLTFLEADCQGDGALDTCQIDEADCNGNQVFDECDIARGEAPDCNENDAPDSCDIASGFSLDENNDQVPDECVFAPPPPEAEAGGFRKPRWISFTVPASQTPTALKVVLQSLHHPDPPYTVGEVADFSSFEGQVRWVGPPAEYVESSASGIVFRASRLQCSPHYEDWSTVGLLHVTGSAVVPSSIFQVINVPQSCEGDEANCNANSTPLELITTRWSDVEIPFNPPSTTTQPDVGDCSSLINKFRNAPGSPIKSRALISGNDAFGNFDIAQDLSFAHISASLDAFRGQGYPHTISTCP